MYGIYYAYVCHEYILYTFNIQKIKRIIWLYGYNFNYNSRIMNIFVSEISDSLYIFGIYVT